MESNQAAIGLLFIILLVIVANLVMYAIVRGWAPRSGRHDGDWMSSLKASLSKPIHTPANKSMDELRKRVQELKKKKRKIGSSAAAGVSFTNDIHHSYEYTTIHSSYINHGIVSLDCFR